MTAKIAAAALIVLIAALGGTAARLTAQTATSTPPDLAATSTPPDLTPSIRTPPRPEVEDGQRDGSEGASEATLPAWATATSTTTGLATLTGMQDQRLPLYAARARYDFFRDARDAAREVRRVHALGREAAGTQGAAAIEHVAHMVRRRMVEACVKLLPSDWGMHTALVELRDWGMGYTRDDGDVYERIERYLSTSFTQLGRRPYAGDPRFQLLRYTP